MANREEIIKAANQMEALPSAAVEALQIARDEDATPEQLAKILEKDANLTSQVLRYANSAQFGNRRGITDVKFAIIRLGFKAIMRVVLSAAFASKARKAVKGYDLPPGEMWRHSLGVALMSRMIAERLSIVDGSLAYVGGLLHDIGKTLLGTYLEVDGQEISNLAREKNITFDAAEREILGIDHAEVGSIMLNEWGVPPAYVDAAHWHHQPNDYRGQERLVDIVHCADCLMMMSGVGVGGDGLMYKVCNEAFGRIQLSPERSQELMAEAIQVLDSELSAFAS